MEIYCGTDILNPILERTKIYIHLYKEKMNTKRNLSIFRIRYGTISVEDINILIKDLDDVVDRVTDIFMDLRLMDPLHIILMKDKIVSKRRRLIRIKNIMTCPISSREVSFVQLRKYLISIRVDLKNAIETITKVKKDRREFEESCLKALKLEKERRERVERTKLELIFDKVVKVVKVNEYKL